MWHSSAQTFIIFLVFLLQQILSFRWMSLTIFCLRGAHWPQPQCWWYFWSIRRQRTHNRRQRIHLLAGPALWAGACKKIFVGYQGAELEVNKYGISNNKNSEIWCSLLFCLYFGSLVFYKNWFELETCPRMSPLI